MYTELRVRKIRTLEEMAAIRDRYNELGKEIGIDLSKRLKMVTSVASSPPFLRRPCEDWYTVILMSFVNAVALGVALAFFGFVVTPNWIKYSSWGKGSVIGLGLLVFGFLF